ncbi:MAG: carboxypeptidase-like regulatory protein, partial [Chitinophagaceae bacterium]|nr:carboxypeptidase-like regulatory protein [Chitinophagaceae bacterium]
RWGKFFTENFIGRSGLADGCRILNKEVLRFRNSKTTHQLTVTAAEPLLIENKVLGYRLQYQLEDFNFNFQTRTLFYYGYPFFVDLGLVNKRKAAKWHKSREEVYYGSMMHFMRSAYNNGLGEEGFEMIRIKKIPNERKKLVQESMRSMSVNGHIVLINSTDRNILSEPDFINVTDNKIIPADSITYKIDSTSREMFFTDYVRVFYKPAKAPPDYTRDFPAENRLMISELTLINQHAIKIEKSGNYYMPTDLFTSGFWAWSEKVCSMLPFDYELPANPASQK